MQVLTRRELCWMMAVASAGCKGRGPVQARPIVDFLQPIGQGRRLASISENARQSLGA